MQGPLNRRRIEGARNFLEPLMAVIVEASAGRRRLVAGCGRAWGRDTIAPTPYRDVAMLQARSVLLAVALVLLTTPLVCAAKGPSEDAAVVGPAGDNAFVLHFDALSGTFHQVPFSEAKALGMQGRVFARSRRGEILEFIERGEEWTAAPEAMAHTIVGALDAYGRVVTTCVEHGIPLEQHGVAGAAQ